MHFGICMSTIDHARQTKSEARQLALELKDRYHLTSIELVLEGIGRRFAPYPWEFEATELEALDSFLSHFQHKGAHLPFFNMNVIASNERVREDAMDQMREAIEIAKRLDLDYAVIHATGTTEGIATEREPRRQYLAFTRLAGYCEGSKLILAIENASNLHNLKDCAAMIRRLKADGLPVAMTFDTGHANIPKTGGGKAAFTGNGTVADAIESCADIIGNIHLHNNHGASDQHLGLLDGSIDLKSCMDRLHEVNYQGCVSLEVGAGVDDLSAEVAMLTKWCQAS